MTPRPRPTRRALLRGGVLATIGCSGCLGVLTDGAPEPPDGDAVRWTHWTGGPVRQRPTVADGVVYVGGGTNDRATRPDGSARPATSEDVLAIDAADGSELWRYQAAAGVAAEPVVRDGVVYAVVGWETDAHGRAQRLVRVDSGSSRAWATKPVDATLTLLAVDDETAYLGTSSGRDRLEGQRVVAVDLGDGSERWSVPAGNATVGSLAGDVLCVGEAGRRTRALDASDGSERWRRDEPPVDELRTFEETVLLAGPEDDERSRPAVAVDVTDGSVRWRFAPSDETWFVPAEVAVGDDAVYVTDDDRTLFALDAAAGTERWKYDFEDEQQSPPAASGDAAYATTPGTVHRFDAATGEHRWDNLIPSNPEPPVANRRGVVVPAEGEEHGRHVRAFAPDGTRRWSFWSGERDLGQTAVRGSRAYVPTDAGHVVALGAASQ